MNNIDKVYIIFSAIIFAIMFFVFIGQIFSKNKTPVAFMLPVGTGMLTIPICAAYIFSDTYEKAMLFESLYFICTEWVCLSMLVFTVAYCKTKLENKNVWAVPIVLCFLDSIALIANLSTKYYFDLTEIPKNADWMSHWVCNFKWPNYIHFGWCYILVLTSLAILLRCATRVSHVYKKNYITIFVAFMIAGAANAICFSLKLVVDFSVLLYPLLAAFIYYYSIYGLPRHLLGTALKYVNESFNNAILFFDDKDECIYKNSQARKLFLQNGSFSAEKAVKLLVQTRKKQLENSSTTPIEFFVVDDAERQFELQAEDIYFGYELIGSYLKLADKTEEIQKYLSQRYLANHDALTGVYNREHFFEVCDNKMNHHPDTEYIMFSSNIVQFKLINELFGEEIGDKVLIALVNISKQKLHDCIIGRISDDKFACLVKKESFDKEYLLAINTAMQNVIEGSIHKIILRVGICPVHGTTESAQLLYDKTQLVIKKLGDDYTKNIGYYDSDLMDELLRERQIINEFESSLEQGRISMYLQPFVDGDKNITGAEALSRWNHSTYGIILPETFIPILERSGLVHKLDTFIWHQAAKTLDEWQRRDIHNIQISVNVSSKDIFYIDIPKEFESLFSKYSFNPKNLKIEFTERAITADTKKAAEIFKKLKYLGFEIGIDDFGHGYSSLNMLKDVNADILKMDMVLIQRNENPERAKAILNFISQISRALGMRLISEGVETSEQLEMLKKLGCNYFQGFYFSHPMSVGDFEDRYMALNKIKVSNLL